MPEDLPAGPRRCRHSYPRNQLHLLPQPDSLRHPAANKSSVAPGLSAEARSSHPHARWRFRLAERKYPRHPVLFSYGNEVSQNRWIARLMTSANLTSSIRGRTRQTMSYLWVTVGSALGGLLRYAISRLMV